MVSVPHLQIQSSRDLVFSLIPGKHGLFFWDDDLLFSHEVVKGVDEAPVEVALSSDGVVVDVCVLLVLLLPLQPTVTVTKVQDRFTVFNKASMAFNNCTKLLKPKKVMITLAQICHSISPQWRYHHPPGRPHLCSRRSPSVQTWTRNMIRYITN